VPHTPHTGLGGQCSTLSSTAQLGNNSRGPCPHAPGLRRPCERGRPAPYLPGPRRGAFSRWIASTGGTRRVNGGVLSSASSPLPAAPHAPSNWLGILAVHPATTTHSHQRPPTARRRRIRLRLAASRRRSHHSRFDGADLMTPHPQLNALPFFSFPSAHRNQGTTTVSRWAVPGCMRGALGSCQRLLRWLRLRPPRGDGRRAPESAALLAREEAHGCATGGILAFILTRRIWLRLLGSTSRESRFMRYHRVCCGRFSLAWGGGPALPPRRGPPAALGYASEGAEAGF